MPENENRPVAIQVSGVKKMYKLGQIGGGTLRADFESWWAKKRGKEDPNSIIGEEERSHGDTFMALNGIDLTIYQGEAVGIIGSNGAGKSTLLKLLSRVTAPTEGEIDIYGRIASMLEVGTGFNGELTGRENVYMNGAILGMTKQEIDAKMEEIIEFSEVREFIDTPVKRYSSGMFVKLAFSVAAHLDAEIMIMDEVLAVGDMAFQKKCLTKMREAAKQDGRTVLYVSHNMNTIRQLCDRCIVLDKGKVVFEGDVEDAIIMYMGMRNISRNVVDLSAIKRTNTFHNHPATMEILRVESTNSVFTVGSIIQAQLRVSSKERIEDVFLGISLKNSAGMTIARFESPIAFSINKSTTILFKVDISFFAPGRYSFNFILSLKNGLGMKQLIDGVNEAYTFEIIPTKGFNNGEVWNQQYNGYIVAPQIELLKYT